MLTTVGEKPPISAISGSTWGPRLEDMASSDSDLSEARIFLSDFGESFLLLLLHGTILIYQFNPSSDWMIKEKVDTVGKLPSEWWQKWDARLRWFSEEGRRNHGGVGRSLVERSTILCTIRDRNMRWRTLKKMKKPPYLPC